MHVCCVLFILSIVWYIMGVSYSARVAIQNNALIFMRGHLLIYEKSESILWRELGMPCI